MEPVQSFAPLAARLAARADEIRPADGAEANWANFMALFFCAILQMLIALCESLDARAAEVARLAAAVDRHDRDVRLARAAHPARAATPFLGRGPRLVWAADAEAIVPARHAPLSGPTSAAPSTSWRALGAAARRDLDPGGRLLAFPPRKAAWRRGIRHAYTVTIS